jgi:hypothetical protein
LNQVLTKRFCGSLTRLIARAATLGFLTCASVVVPTAVPMSAAPEATPKRPSAELHLAAFLPTEAPGSVSMLLAGGALMAFGLMGRKRRAEKVSERR